ncbi:hypothetical protein [Streptomyces sp. NPDC020681]|uniref:hypothetical protein n=1 Tax=Streptomyces sp. NPDC020681 TaxID=3365083 RepID=UPI0037AAE8C1
MELHRTEPDAAPDDAASPEEEPVLAVSDPAPVAEPAASEPVPLARRRGRTAVLLAVAAVIGISAGTAVGYRVQADRAPTPLPALNQPELGYPAKPLPDGQAPEPLSAAEDRRVKTDGDLRKLLLPRPKGARAADEWRDDGWVDTATYAAQFEKPGSVFGQLVQDDIRRVAGASWAQGGNKVTDIVLVQFRSGGAAMDHAEGQHAYMPETEYAGNGGDPLSGSGNGRYYLYPAEESAGFLPMYQARAIFQRGDIMVDINIFDEKRISKDEIRSLAERQLERLS